MKMLKLPSKLPSEDKNAGVEAKRMIIEEMESLFGSRDNTFTIDESIVYHNGSPRVWTYDTENKKCNVVLSNGCLTYWPCFVYEMAHESIHLLNPQPVAASYLEEGIAVWFSDYMMEKCGYEKHYPKGDYKKALELVALIKDTPPNIVKKIRDNYPNLTDISFAELRRLYPTLTIKQAKALTSIKE
ncbi:hypothetical protein VRM69_000935 [Enterobacter hormaechei]|jgi:hypothetical protein|nr:hypothetical protein [Enterobacter hormaechei]TYF28083.1 hypothetical protein DJ489_10720 [Enterobacter hormaechei]